MATSTPATSAPATSTGGTGRTDRCTSKGKRHPTCNSDSPRQVSREMRFQINQPANTQLI
jgi:hypothetical protein